MSEIRANTISNAAGTGAATLTGQYAAKAWVNFNGTGTVAIRESGNVSSVTDSSVGYYSITFASSLSDANYAAAGFTQGDPPQNNQCSEVGGYNPTSSSLDLRSWNTTGSAFYDGSAIAAIITR